MALAVGLAWQLVERIPRAPEAGVSESQPPPEAERALEPPPALAEEPAPEEPPAEAAPLGDVPADAPTLEDLAVIELLHVLHELGDVGGAPR